MVARKRHTKKTKRRSKKRSIARYKKLGGASEERTYVFIIPYRARGTQTERRGQLQNGMNSIRECFTANKKTYKIFIVEQDNEHPFNMGILKNIGFLEAEKIFGEPKVYLHFNADYSIDTSQEFPKELDEFDGNGFLEIHAGDINDEFEHKLIGGCTCFNSSVFKQLNGFPNNFFGYGGEDAALRSRVVKLKIPYIRNTLLEKNWVTAEDITERNFSRMQINGELLAKNSSEISGLSTCEYVINGRGEFYNPADNIHHLLADFEFTESQ